MNEVVVRLEHIILPLDVEINHQQNDNFNNITTQMTNENTLSNGVNSIENSSHGELSEF